MNNLFETDLQSRLTGTDGLRVRQDILQRLEAMEGDLAGALRSGLSRGDFAKVTALAMAVASSKQVITETLSEI